MDLINRNRVYQSMADWQVPREWADVMYRYLVHGWEPGSMFTAMLANDARRMILGSHPSNPIEAYKTVAGWITDVVPVQARDSYPAVAAWSKLTNEERHQILAQQGLLLTPEAATFAVLKGAANYEVDLDYWYHY
jgi:hypothetical protein